MAVIGILPHLKKDGVIPATARLAELLTKAGFTVLMTEADANQIGRPEAAVSVDELKNRCELVIVLGGDGSLLYGAQILYPRAIPMFGINLGHLGFLTEFEAGQMEEVVRLVQEGKFFCEDRTMVRAEVIRSGQVAAELVGLNDIVIAKATVSRILKMRASIDGQFLADYPADGLIVATPTGSTAYSLSAGGPILDPRLSALILNPICAHSLFALPLVVGGGSSIEITFAAIPGEVRLIADGQVSVDLTGDDLIRFTTAPHPTRFARFRARSFYQILRDRVQAGKL
ncbi:MAG TPA: NAD(+)/NADH kinase [Firmicutes bacterium]|nr:NAD(+)/NADH kinase [Bacillota bacterium]